MATDKQIEANRRNALLSTGPRSLAGKEKSSRNAIKHGLTASQRMLPGEDPAEFAGMRESFFNWLKPKGDVELQLVERAVSLIWRLRRVQAFEAALIEWMAYHQATLHDATVPDVTALDRRNDPDPLDEEIHDLQDPLRLGRAVAALLSKDLTTKLTLYEMRMQRQLSQILKDFREMKRSRIELARLAAEKGRSAPAPDNDEYVAHKGKWLKKIGPP